MTVCGVLAEADVGDPYEVRRRIAKRPESHGDRSEWIRGTLAAVVFLRRQPKEQKAADAGGDRFFRDPRDVANRKTRVPGKRGDLG